MAAGSSWRRCWAVLGLGLAVQWAATIAVCRLHFRTNRQPGLPPVRPGLPNRTELVVLCLVDGMGLEPGLSDHFGGNFLREMVEEGRAQLGVATVRLPSETRPGHAAVLGGVHEDPAMFGRRMGGLLADSELGGGPHSQSTRFETLYDVAPRSWSFWPDNQPIYWDVAARVDRTRHTATVEPWEYVELSSCNDYDMNAFEMVERRLRNSSWRAELRAATQALVHIEFVSPDCENDDSEVVADTAATGRLIERLWKSFNRTLPDRRVTFVVTSDHGTLSGRHGWAHPALTHVPVIAWGAGVRRAASWPAPVPYCADRWCCELFEKLALGTMKKDRLGVARLEQKDIASMVAALLGTPIPQNARGVVPVDMLDLSPQERVEHLLGSALQRSVRLDAVRAENKSPERLRERIWAELPAQGQERWAWALLARLSEEELAAHLTGAAGMHAVVVVALGTWQLLAASEALHPREDSAGWLWLGAVGVVATALAVSPLAGCVVAAGVASVSLVPVAARLGVGEAIRLVAVVGGATAVAGACSGAWFKEQRGRLGLPWIALVCAVVGRAPQRSLSTVLLALSSLGCCALLTWPLDDERDARWMVAAGTVAMAPLSFGWFSSRSQLARGLCSCGLLVGAAGLSWVRPESSAVVCWMLLAGAAGICMQPRQRGETRLMSALVSFAVLQALIARWAEPCFHSLIAASLIGLLTELHRQPLGPLFGLSARGTVLAHEMLAFVALHMLLFGFNSFDQAAHIIHRQPVRTDLLYGLARAPNAAMALCAVQYGAAVLLAGTWRKVVAQAAGPTVDDLPGMAKASVLAFALVCSGAVQCGLSPWGSLAATNLELPGGAIWVELQIGGPRAAVYSCGALIYFVFDALGTVGLAGTGRTTSKAT